MIQVTDLKVSVNNKEILNKVNLKVNKGEIVVIFGPNGSGKTTLLNAIMGLSKYQVKGGRIKFKDKLINSWPIEKRAKAGIGLLWQKPPKIVGVKLAEIIKTVDVKEQDQEIVKDLKANKFIKRGVNDDLSGGELKRSELLQLAVQDPELMLLDEPDSGVDLDNCKLLARVIDNWRIKGKSVLLVTHGGNLLKYLSAERAYVMIDGRFSCQGEPKRIFKAISECGYEGCANCLRRRKDG